MFHDLDLLDTSRLKSIGSVSLTLAKRSARHDSLYHLSDCELLAIATRLRQFIEIRLDDLPIRKTNVAAERVAKQALEERLVWIERSSGQSAEEVMASLLSRRSDFTHQRMLATASHQATASSNPANGWLR